MVHVRFSSLPKRDSCCCCCCCDGWSPVAVAEDEAENAVKGEEEEFMEYARDSGKALEVVFLFPLSIKGGCGVG